MAGCGPFPRLITPRLAGLSGPFMQPSGSPGVCIKSAGNFLGVGKPGSSPKAFIGLVVDGTTVRVTFTQCVNIVSPTGIEFRVDGGAWTVVSAVAKVSDTVWSFTVAPAITAGQTVDWRYVGGSNSIVTCDTAEDIGDQFLPDIDNPLVLAGSYILLETGGSDVILLEDWAVDPDDGITLEDSPSD